MTTITDTPISAFIDCEDCLGSGEIHDEPHGWWEGSGVFTRITTCHTCEGSGGAMMSPIPPQRVDGPEWEPSAEDEAWYCAEVVAMQ